MLRYQESTHLREDQLSSHNHCSKKSSLLLCVVRKEASCVYMCVCVLCGCVGVWVW